MSEPHPRLEELKARLRVWRAELEESREMNAVLRDSLATLHASNGRLRTEVMEMYKARITMHESNTTLTAENEKLRAKVQALTEENNKLTAENLMLQGQNQELVERHVFDAF